MRQLGRESRDATAAGALKPAAAGTQKSHHQSNISSTLFFLPKQMPTLTVFTQSTRAREPAAAGFSVPKAVVPLDSRPRICGAACPIHNVHKYSTDSRAAKSSTSNIASVPAPDSATVVQTAYDAYVASQDVDNPDSGAPFHCYAVSVLAITAEGPAAALTSVPQYLDNCCTIPPFSANVQTARPF